MTNASDARKAHKLLDYVSQGRAVLDDEIKLLRSFLPELPKQKTLEEIIAHVRDAWVGANDNDWAGNSYDRDTSIEDWMAELYVQMNGLKDAPATVPALPAGMRLADHEEYGRVVVSPGANRDGYILIFTSNDAHSSRAAWHYVEVDTLNFVDIEPAHPEFLETEADYAAAPEGTIAACDESTPWHKFDSVWLSSAVYESSSSKDMTDIIRRILRWGWGE